MKKQRPQNIIHVLVHKHTGANHDNYWMRALVNTSLFIHLVNFYSISHFCEYNINRTCDIYCSSLNAGPQNICLDPNLWKLWWSLYRHILFYCASLYCALQIWCFYFCFVFANWRFVATLPWYSIAIIFKQHLLTLGLCVTW